MVDCHCKIAHPKKLIVLTGGPGAGKTAVLELVRQHFCRHVEVLPEAASILFGGGFRRGQTEDGRKAAQRAIFHVQREQEAAALAESEAAILLCDRGTIDGLAYWPGPGDFLASVASAVDLELSKYAAVIHLRTPSADHGYDFSNPVRVESAVEAARVDQLISAAWSTHPRRFFVESSASFIDKAARALDLLRGELPECCRHHVVPTVDQVPSRRG